MAITNMVSGEPNNALLVKIANIFQVSTDYLLTGKKYKTYNFKNRLIELRKQNNWTKTQVANRLGISIPAYSGYEQGTREPTLEKARKLAEMFNVTLDSLLYDGYLKKIDLKNETSLFYGDRQISKKELDIIKAILSLKSEK